MKKFLALFLVLTLLLLPSALAEDNAPTAWYELSGNDTIVTVWLPGVSDDGMNWMFEISVPEALELITHETIDNGDGTTLYAASFMSTASAPADVSLILRYAANDYEAADQTRVLEMKVSDTKELSVISVLERAKEADWLTFEDGGYIMLVTLTEEEDHVWSMSITDPEVLELITCDSENGFIGSFKTAWEKAGFSELNITAALPGEDEPSLYYTVNLFVNESGELMLQWVDTFTILESSSALPAAWLENDTENHILTLTLPEQSDGVRFWNISISDETVLELITCDTESGFIGSFKAAGAKAGSADLTLTYGTEDTPEAIYTVRLSVGEDGALSVEDAYSVK